MFPSTSTTLNVSTVFPLANVISLTIVAGDSAVSNIYGVNLGRLQELKAKYDPNNVFHKMHPITREANV